MEKNIYLRHDGVLEEHAMEISWVGQAWLPLRILTKLTVESTSAKTYLFWPRRHYLVESRIKVITSRDNFRGEVIG